MKIAAAAYPLDALPDFSAYAAKITRWVEDAAAQDANLLVFPEYGAMELASLGGPNVAQDIEAALHEVARHTGAVRDLHCTLATRHNLHILGASGPAFTDTRPTNRATLYGPGGVIGHQDKLIMTRFEREEWHIAPGTDITLFDTPLGRIGILICYDSEFPLLARAMVAEGAEILLVPSCTDSMAGYSRVRVGAMARALEGQCVTVQAPTVGDATWCPAVDVNIGAAAIYGPPDHGWPDTGVLAQSTLNTPGWAIAEVSTTLVRQTRQDGGVLNFLHWNEQENRLHTPVQTTKTR